jgi:hypothetical protein
VLNTPSAATAPSTIVRIVAELMSTTACDELPPPCGSASSPGSAASTASMYFCWSAPGSNWTR